MKRTLFIAASAITATFTNGEPMKLINMKTGFVVVEFKSGKAQFYDRFLEAEMKETGILIPPSMASSFGDKEVIFLNDPFFEKAFIEVYYPLCIAHTVYQWQK
jgi:hypothetical protein